MIAAPVEAVPAKAQATGSLWAAALKPGGDRWESGLAWRPERCFTAVGYGPCDPEPELPDFEIVGPTAFYPVGYRVQDECTTLNGEMDAERIRRQAEATASFQAARELWTGALSAAAPATVDGAPYVNPSLMEPDAVVVAPNPIGSAVADKLGALEAAAMTDANGQQVWLHVPPLAVLALGNLLTQRGDNLYTPLGNLVIGDAGYTGQGPAGTGTTWAYATGPVAVRLSPIEVFSDRATTLDRTTNRQEIWASRLFAVTFDPCTKYAIDLGPGEA